MTYPRIIILFGVAISIMIFAISTMLYSRSSLSDQNSSKLDTVGGHTPGYPILQTTGDVLDPTSFVINPKTAVVEPMKYLREFNYQRLLMEQ
jgi:manganese oxidase